MKKLKLVQYFEVILLFVIVKISGWPKTAGIVNLENGVELAKKEGKSLVIVSNHLSDLDPFFLMAILPPRLWKDIFPIITLGKPSLFNKWWKKILMNAIGGVSITNNTEEKGWHTPLLKIARKLKRAENVCFFPEGQVCPDGEMGKDLGTVATLAKIGEFILMPIRIAGIKNYRPRYFKILFQSGKLSVFFGEAIAVKKGSCIDVMEIIKNIDNSQCEPKGEERS